MVGVMQQSVTSSPRHVPQGLEASTLQHPPKGSAASSVLLSVVMPVYNEQAVVGQVIDGFVRVLGELRVPFEVIALNDGSCDGTAGELEAAAARHPGVVRVLGHPNRGHGPTLLRGLAEARGEWVFHTDSDDEMPPEPLAALWARRHEAPLLLGWRQGREAPLARRMVTAGARLAARVLIGGAPRDINTPYRLMHAPTIGPAWRALPPDTFAPNVLIAGWACRHGLPLVELPVPHRGRRTGRVSLTSMKLWRAAARALWQTARLARAMRRLEPGTVAAPQATGG
jgi:glycosyltransferase involved in cell wall biosynthesis